MRLKLFEASVELYYQGGSRECCPLSAQPQTRRSPVEFGEQSLTILTLAVFCGTQCQRCKLWRMKSLEKVKVQMSTWVKSTKVESHICMCIASIR